MFGYRDVPLADLTFGSSISASFLPSRSDPVFDGHEIARVEVAVTLELSPNGHLDARARLRRLASSRAEQCSMQGQSLPRQAAQPRRRAHHE